MSERIVDNPGNHGWVDVGNGRWEWEGGSTTGHIEDGTIDGQITTWDAAKTEWMPNGAVVVDASGNVGINNNDPTSYYTNRFVVGANYADGITIASEAPNQLNYLMFANSDEKASVAGAIGYYHSANASNPDTMNFITDGTERMRIDANGHLLVSNGGRIYSMSASGISPFIVEKDNGLTFWTDSNERMRIESNGNVRFAGFEFASTAKLVRADNGCGLQIGNGWVGPNLRDGTDDGGVSLGRADFRFKDGHFNGTVNAQKFVGDGSGLTGISAGGNYVPLSGNSTVNGTITATDFIATSDERLKDDITPLPVGLIDDIKPVQWNWKDGSGKSAGVIAQQLQAIGLDDFVNEDADGNLGVNYNALVGVLLAEVISLKAEVESLK